MYLLLSIGSVLKIVVPWWFKPFFLTFQTLSNHIKCFKAVSFSNYLVIWWLLLLPILQMTTLRHKRGKSLIWDLHPITCAPAQVFSACFDLAFRTGWYGAPSPETLDWLLPLPPKLVTEEPQAWYQLPSGGSAPGLDTKKLCFPPEPTQKGWATCPESVEERRPRRGDWPEHSLEPL